MDVPVVSGAAGVSRRYVLTALAAGLGGVALAACGAGGQGGQSAAPTAKDAPPVKISFAAHGDQSWQEFWNKVVDRFNTTYGPKITAEFFSSEPDGFKKYVVLMASGEMWDVFRNEEKRMPEFAHNKTLLDVTSPAGKDKETKKEDFPESIWNEFFWEGKQYGFGHDLSPAVIFYNRGLLKAKGVALPPTKWGDASWTPAAFLEAAKKLTFGSGSNQTWGFVGNTWWVYMHPWVWGNGGSIVSPDNKKVTLDDPKTLEMLQWYDDLGKVHQVIPNAAELKDMGGDSKGFQTGRIAMYVNNTSYTITLRQYMQQDPSFDWEMAPFPTGKAGAFTRIPNNIVTSWSGSKQPDACWTFMKFMASKEATVDARGIPSRLPAATLPEVLGRTPNQNWRLLAEAGKVRKSEPRTPYFSDFDENTLKPGWVDVLNGKRTVREMVQDLQPKLQAILDGKGKQ